MLRMLARRRVLLVFGLIAATLIGVLMAFRVSLSPFELTSRRALAVSASGSALVEARRPRPTDPDSSFITLPLRGGLLADMLSTDAARAQLAARLDAHPDEVVVFGPSTAEPYVPVPTAARGGEAATATGEPYVLTLTASTTVPIITLHGTAPDRGAAAALIDAAISTLQRLAASGTTSARSMRVLPLGRPRVTVESDSRYVGVAVASALFVLCAWIVGLGLLDRWARARRRRRAASGGSAHDPDVPPVGRRLHTN